MSEQIKTARINDRYKSLYSFYLGKKVVKEGLLEAGPINVKVDYEVPPSDDEPSMLVTGTLNKDSGLITGMKVLYSMNVLEASDVQYKIIDKNTIQLLKKVKNAAGLSPASLATSGSEYKGVFESRGLKHILIEPFRPENLANWTPKTETDIYLAWGVLKEYIGYTYCCGASAAILKELGYNYSDQSKPDAILINDGNKAYVIAEMKIKSSQFKLNHKKDDVDVLVVWDDDETDRSVLPNKIICLHELAKTAAIESFDDDDLD